MLKTKFVIMYRPRCICFGISIGQNHKIKGKYRNLFFELDILFWTFGLEFII